VLIFFLQTVIEVVFLFMLPKFIEECNRMLPDGAVDSARCMGLCTHCMCHSTMPNCPQM